MVLEFLNGRSGGNTELHLMQALKGKQSGHTVSCYMEDDELISTDGSSMCIRRVYIKDSEYTIGWVVDEDVDDCMCCGDKFNWFKRRHHCRNCGNLVCGDCSPFKSKVPNFPETKSRVCKDCFGLKQEKNSNKRWASFSEADSIVYTDRINDLNNNTSSDDAIRRPRACSFDSRNIPTSNNTPIKLNNNADMMDDLASFVMAYKKMRTFIPLNIWDTTVANLEEMGMPSSITTRIWNTRVLWLIVMPPQDIIKIHIADLRGKYAPIMLDIVETRALWFALSKVNKEEWEKHPQKVEWKENLGQSLQSMTSREIAGNLSKLEQRNPAYFTRGEDGVECTDEIVMDLFDPEAVIEKRYFTVGNGKTVRHSFKSEDNTDKIAADNTDIEDNDDNIDSNIDNDDNINIDIHIDTDASIDIDIDINADEYIITSILDHCHNIQPFTCTENNKNDSGSGDDDSFSGYKEMVTATLTEEVELELKEEEKAKEIVVAEVVEEEKVIELEEVAVVVEELVKEEVVVVEDEVVVNENNNEIEMDSPTQTKPLSITPKITTPIANTTNKVTFTPASLSRTRLMMYADNTTSISSPNDPWAWSSPSTSDVSNSPLSPGMMSGRSPVKTLLSNKLDMQRQIMPPAVAANRNQIAMATFNSMRSPQHNFPTGYSMSMIGAPVMGVTTSTTADADVVTPTPGQTYGDGKSIRHVATPWAETPSAIRGVLGRLATDVVVEPAEHEKEHSFFYSDNESEEGSPNKSNSLKEETNKDTETTTKVNKNDSLVTLQELANISITINSNTESNTESNSKSNSNTDADATNVLGLDYLVGYIDSPLKVDQVSPESTTTDNSNFMQGGEGSNGNALGLESMSDYFASPEFQNLTPPLRAAALKEKLKGKQSKSKSPKPRISVSASQLKQDFNREERSPLSSLNLNGNLSGENTSINAEVSRKRSPGASQSPMPEHLFRVLTSNTIDVENQENKKILKQSMSNSKTKSSSKSERESMTKKKDVHSSVNMKSTETIKAEKMEKHDIESIKKEFSDLLMHGKATMLRHFAEEHADKTDGGDPITTLANKIGFDTIHATDVLIQCAAEFEGLEEALETLMILCDLGGDVNAKDASAQGRSVLASVFNEPLLGRFLLMRGADPLQEDDDGESTLKLCVDYGYNWILEATQSSRMFAHLTQTSSRKKAYIEAVITGGKGSTIKSLVDKGSLELSSEEATDLLLKCKEKVHEIDDPDSTFEVLKQLGAQE